MIEQKIYDVIDLTDFNQSKDAYFIISYAMYECNKPFLPRIVKLNNAGINKSTIERILKAVDGEVLLSISFLGFMTDIEFNQ